MQSENHNQKKKQDIVEKEGVQENGKKLFSGRSKIEVPVWQ